MASLLSVDADEFDVEDERGAGRNDARVSPLPVPVVGAARQLGFLADGHFGDTVVPSSNNLTLPDLKLKGLAAIPGGVELRAVGESSGVMDLHRLARLGIVGFITL